MDTESITCIGSFILNIAGFEVPGDICYHPNDASIGANAIVIRVPQTDEMVSAAMEYMGISSPDDIQARITTIRAGDEGGPAVAIMLVDARAA